MDRGPGSSANPAPAMSSRDGSPSSGSGATKRLMRELDVWRREQEEEKGIERLGPVSDDGLLEWQAVINGRGIGGGYEGELTSDISHGIPTWDVDTFFFSLSLFFFFPPNSSLSAGRWLIAISIPAAYPMQPPKIRFATPVVHPNVALRSGEICLDLLADAWTPAYSVLECVRALRMLLACPEVDSPLNVDVAALLRQGDVVGARRLVECWCLDEAGRYDGP
ncbi:hypothetical protein XA68_13862 [Ophiocordyceps unilateralis]|uniref:UBC core domain-containing protein n=1 Tax=Ophiocordyceps unilateralis TaxID=268505 RepID=A0A2A9PA92_OPHUN|nr:hypothetical protein XA68_13862 [Ophiocordyceps unilateralis]